MRKGFACQGNEFSHYMLLSSYFILNRYRSLPDKVRASAYLRALCRTDGVKMHKLYPYVHSFSNAPTRDAMLYPVFIPDVLPSALPPGSDFSLVAGK